MMRAALFLCTLLAFAGCQSAPPEPKVEPLLARFFLEVGPGEKGVTVELPVSHVNINVGPRPVLGEYDIAAVDVTRSNHGWCMVFDLNPAAMRDLYDMSVVAHGRRLVLALNGVPIGVRQLEQPIKDGELLVFVEVEDTQLAVLADRIRRTTQALAQHPRK